MNRKKVDKDMLAIRACKLHFGNDTTVIQRLRRIYALRQWQEAKPDSDKYDQWIAIWLLKICGKHTNSQRWLDKVVLNNTLGVFDTEQSISAKDIVEIIAREICWMSVDDFTKPDIVWPKKYQGEQP